MVIVSLSMDNKDANQLQNLLSVARLSKDEKDDFRQLQVGTTHRFRIASNASPISDSNDADVLNHLVEASLTRDDLVLMAFSDPTISLLLIGRCKSLRLLIY